MLQAISCFLSCSVTFNLKLFLQRRLQNLYFPAEEVVVQRGKKVGSRSPREEEAELELKPGLLDS